TSWDSWALVYEDSSLKSELVSSWEESARRYTMTNEAASGPVYVVLADHVSAHEPGCLTYQLSVGEGDPDSLVIFERYISKQYLEEVHWQSEAFKCFGAKVREADLWESKEVTKLHEELPGAFGFMARHNG
ncbi:ABM domain-containing protein, partial [Haematococcus lacustris]